MPTSEWNAATSSGIDVIGTRRAITAPMLPPMATPRITSIQPRPSAGGWGASVGATAIAMPAMPRKLPRRLDAGLDSPRSDRMNRTPATRYSSAARLAFMNGPPPLSSSAKADDPVFRNGRDLQNRHGILDAPPEPVVGLAEGETRWRGLTISIRKSASRHFFFFWYIASMRCVTRKPPKIFTDAKVSAMKPKPRAQTPPLPTCATPTARSAPTTITEEIALVTDIRGVASAGVTDHTTK